MKIEINDGRQTREDWLWSRFPSAPHRNTKLPFRLEFTEFDLGSGKGQYIIASAGKDKSWMISLKDGKKNVEKIVLGKSYSFINEAYSFQVKSAAAGVATREDWRIGSEGLLNPALIATMKRPKTSRQVVLQLNKPAHFEGGLVLLYRPRKKTNADSAGRKEKGI